MTGNREKRKSMEKIQLLNVFADNLTEIEFLDQVEHKMKKNTPFYVLFVNVDVLIKAENNKYLKKIICNADYTLIDGMPLIWISKLYKKPFKHKISGSDVTPKLCELAAQNSWKIFLLGGAPGVPEKAAKKLVKKYSHLSVVGTYSPPLGFENNKNEIEKINHKIKKSKADIVIVCLGCPKQEIYVYNNLKECGAKMCICAGGTIDFLAGTIRRCPRWVSLIGFEWFFRFLMEPKRMFKRYFIDDMKIFKMIWKYRWQGKAKLLK